MDSALKTMIDNMPEKTGKPLDEWKKVLAAKGFEKHSQAVKFLKTEHCVTHGFANTIVTLFRQDGQEQEDLTTAQYQGKEHLRPIHDKLIGIVKDFGDDVTITPKKTSVSVIRNRQFVLIKPATKKRIDLGFKLPGKPTTDRLGDSGPFGTMCTHRVQLTDLDQVDDELIAWMREAYEQAG
jgi:hypothetical protein